MPRKPPLKRRLRTASRWPLGVAATTWIYLWRTTPFHRTEEEGSWEADKPPDIPDGVSHEELQRVADGYGPFFHRRYRTRIRGSRWSPEELMRRICVDLDRVAPTEFASFQKTKGDKDGLGLGDEYLVQMAGPYDGPVRVIGRTPTSFRLATLDAHLEAGQIEFRTRRDDGMLIFEIESWARSRDRVVDLLYDHLRMAKETQLHMWTSLLELTAARSDGRMTGGIDIHTRKVDLDADRNEQHDRRPGFRRMRLEDLRGLRVNYDPDAPHDPEHGWRIDDYKQPLRSEPPGEPVEGGVFEIAQDLLRNYQVADPKMVRATYDEDAGLEGRDMLLEIRFLGLTVNNSGCRVGQIVDERRTEDGRPVRIWGWPYQTLEGHFEQGEMSWTVWKWLDTGEVEFRVHSYMRNAENVHPILNLGFKVFGQHERRRYLKSACARMLRLTEEALSGEEPSAERTDEPAVD